MTREEAKDLLDNLLGMIEDNHNADYDTALKMGIEALEEQKMNKWISVKFRPLTEEEQKEYPDYPGYCYIADCPMPNDDEEILITTDDGRVEKDVCYLDDGFSLDSGYDWQTDVIAWCELPEPYKAESEDKG